ncbi:hypothetical protein ACTFRD_31450 [Bacillus cereus group sp. MYBK249-1]|uniref:hypothetical protein n=1 Tax=unclassified Bacillus cereus group TaxID=2750818 RepID=UPI003F7B2B65
MKLVEIEERIYDFEQSLILSSIALFFPGIYDFLIKSSNIPQLVTGTSGNVLVIIYVLSIFIFWSVSMYNLIKLKRKKQKILESNDRSR